MLLPISKRELLARVLDNPVVNWPLRRLLDRPALLCLTYHRIAEPDGYDQGVISASLGELDRQVAWLRDHVQVLSGEQVAALVRGELQLKGPAACLTFDDGYADNLLAGEMLMRKHGLPALFFITTGFVGTEVIAPWDRLAYAVRHSGRCALSIAAVEDHGPWVVELGPAGGVRRVKQAYRSVPTALQERFVVEVERAAGARARDAGGPPMFLTWDEVRRLRRMGHGIGAHTHTHPILSKLPLEEQRRELALSRRILEEQLGEPIVHMAYPFGKQGTFTPETQELVRACGYVAAFSFYGGSNAPRRLVPYDLRREAVEQDLSSRRFRSLVRFAPALV